MSKDVVEANAAGWEHIDKLTARIAELERRNAMLSYRISETKGLLAASMHEHRPLSEYEIEINALNDVLSATSADTEKWLQDEIVKRLGEPMAYIVQDWKTMRPVLCWAQHTTVDYDNSITTKEPIPLYLSIPLATPEERIKEGRI